MMMSSNKLRVRMVVCVSVKQVLKKDKIETDRSASGRPRCGVILALIRCLDSDCIMLCDDLTPFRD